MRGCPLCSRPQETKTSPESVALQCRLAEKRAEHSLLAEQVAEVRMAFAGVVLLGCALTAPCRSEPAQI